MSKTWFITGASRGFGHEFAKAAMGRGDAVAATARDMSALQSLVEALPDRVLPLELDVRDKEAVTAAIAETEDRFGGIDVVVNNAGYGHFGAVEELTNHELRDQLDTNVFGALNVTQAALPSMRVRQRGHIVQVSSIGGIGAFANLGAYHASKWALEALSESLAAEVARFGINVTIVEPGGYATDWAGSSARRSNTLDAYEPMRDEAQARRGAQAPGQPAAAAQALLQVVDSPAPPLRVLFGAQASTIVRSIYARRLAEWDRWNALSMQAQGETEEAEGA